jgi:(E)-4-hydroxy-3-methylbut-2-enyl-diphosphate synthase
MFLPYRSREVNIGGVYLGGQNPIRIQSMTNTPTMDTLSTVEQCIRIIQAGADYVRITTPTIQEAENLKNIKKELNIRGYHTPLIADVHFNPDIAEIAAEIVEKVRINPGNYGIKRTLTVEMSEKEYQEELEKINDKLLRLLAVCRRNGTVIRIGVNHGSLSPRIMTRFGDTPEGMVESAMEFVRLCVADNFHNIVISLKSSNARVMTYAYRLLVEKFQNEGYDYPLHLGVTEAGAGEDGRIRSAIGISSLLADGMGDTVRVSLTEAPENEIPVAQAIVKQFSRDSIQPFPEIFSVKNPFEYQRRKSRSVANIGNSKLPVVILDFFPEQANPEDHNFMPDFYYLASKEYLTYTDTQFSYILNLHDWIMQAKDKKDYVFPLYTAAEFDYYGPRHEELNFVIFSLEDINGHLLESIKKYEDKIVLIIESFRNGCNEQRMVLYRLIKHKINCPILVNRNYAEDNTEYLSVRAAMDMGIFFIDGLADGIWIRNVGSITVHEVLNIEFGILQASRVRSSKAEYISCPSCGRTLFDLQSVSSIIRERTSHLRHLKIAIMGCIVNGPGEMADADYGYVGAAPGKVTLYKGKQIVKKNIPADNAVNELVELIKANGDWTEPNV